MNFKIFGTTDIIKIFPDFDSKRLNEWQRKGYIRKLINKWYCFTEIPPSELLQFQISNKLMQPSYVSFATALSYYQFIPEGVYITEAVTTVKTISYDTSMGRFKYQRIKSGYFFGYKVARLENVPVLIAEPEKAILDFFYLNSQLNRVEDFEALRINSDAIGATINWKKLFLYNTVFDSVTLTKRIRLFQKTQQHVTP